MRKYPNLVKKMSFPIRFFLFFFYVFPYPILSFFLLCGENFQTPHFWRGQGGSNAGFLLAKNSTVGLPSENARTPEETFENCVYTLHVLCKTDVILSVLTFTSYGLCGSRGEVVVIFQCASIFIRLERKKTDYSLFWLNITYPNVA